MSLIIIGKGIISVTTIIAQVLCLILILCLLIKKKPFSNIRNFFAKRAGLYAAIVATVAFIGSMFFSNIAYYKPCLLCWYQRIVIFPQTILLWMAYARHEIQTIKWYAYPLLGIGLLLSGYHWIIQLFPPKNPAPCGFDTSCIGRYIYEYGHITIAGMAFTTCLLILLLLLVSEGKKRITK